ncbi:NucA/NucB deoxyribonuclease domain-containing protein [Micromonospora wenchangensis]
MRKSKRILLFAATILLSMVSTVPAHAHRPLRATTVTSTVTLVPVGGKATRTLPPEQRGAQESARAYAERRTKPYVPLEQALAEQRTSNQFHDVFLTEDKTSQLAPVEPDEDWPTKDQCIQAYALDDFEGEWQHRNNYSACQVYLIYFDFLECTATAPPSCNPVGQTEARAVFLGKGWAKARNVDWDIYLDNWRKVWGREEPSQQFKIDVDCARYTTTDDCDVTSSRSTRTLAEWKSNGLHNVFSSTETPTPWPGDEKPQDKRAYFQFTPKITAISTGISTPSYWVVTRCDNASYVTGAGCIFLGTWSRFVMDYNYPNYKESVEFIWDAMTDLESVKPGSVGLYVPGNYRATNPDQRVPLTRNYYGTQSRTKVQNECVRLFGPNYTTGPNGEERDCDEYPFASTYQNANYDTVGSAKTWAVRALNRSHNRSAGSILGDYYVLDHRLDEDPFFVHIINTP